MIDKCTLHISTPGLQYGIRVKNFPILPVGTAVHFSLGDLHFDGVDIIRYRASDDMGTCVIVDYNTSESEDESLKALCVEDKNSFFDYIYPEVIDFGYK